MIGRRTKYTPERVDRFLEAVRKGATFRLAAGFAGIHVDTFYAWQNKYPAFSDAIKEAESVAAMQWLDLIGQAAAIGEWQAAAWKLERRFPHEYGRRINEHTGKDGEVLTIRVERADRPIGPAGQVE